MIVKIMGIADILVALLILIIHFEIGWIRIPLIVSLYLIGKNILFYKNLVSYVDGLIGLYVWIMFFYPSLIDYVAVIYLVQKGISSFF